MNLIDELDELDALERMEKRAFRFSVPTSPSATLAKGALTPKISKPLSSVRPKAGVNTTTGQRPNANSSRFNPTMSSPQSAMGHQANRQVKPIPPAPIKPTF